MTRAFPDGHSFSGTIIRVIVERFVSADPSKDHVPCWILSIRDKATGDMAGYVDLRIGDTESLRLYSGHIGYRVLSRFRGRRFAALACRLAAPPIFRSHGMDEVWITCDPDNAASWRTCELIGAEFVEIVDLPPSDEAESDQGMKQKCRFRWRF